MGDRTRLVLANGRVFVGEQLGAVGEATGEIVFNTSMTGYQEMLTDPSYGGQLLVLTYPLVGNYGINSSDIESSAIQPSGLIIRSHCQTPSHNLSEGSLNYYLAKRGVAGITEVDTRAITLTIRDKGAMMARITPAEDVDKVVRELAKASYAEQELTEQQSWTDISEQLTYVGDKPKIAIVNYGVKNSLIRLISEQNSEVDVLGYENWAEHFDKKQYDGLVFSPGPGNPEHVSVGGDALFRRLLADGLPIFGICLGHQILAQEMGGATYKLKFGHRGGNQPVQDVRTKRVYLTAHNHGYAVSADGLPSELEVTHININDGTIEGLRHKTKPVMSVQYHPEAAPGPHDAEYLFGEFLAMVEAHRR